MIGEEFWELGQYGATGVIIGLIFVILVLVGISYKVTRGFTKVITNHIAHETEAKVKLAESMTKLSGSVDNNTRSTEKLGDRIDKTFNNK